MQTIRVLDSHTGGEPTRIIVEGGPELGTGPLRERLNIFREQFDDLRSCLGRGTVVQANGSHLRGWHNFL